jgi:hypothetical protein
MNPYRLIAGSLKHSTFEVMVTFILNILVILGLELRTLHFLGKVEVTVRSLQEHGKHVNSKTWRLGIFLLCPLIYANEFVSVLGF